MRTKPTLTITENGNATEAAAVTLESDEALSKVIAAVFCGMKKGLDGTMAPLSPDAIASISAVLRDEALTLSAILGHKK